MCRGVVLTQVSQSSRPSQSFLLDSRFYGDIMYVIMYAIKKIYTVVFVGVGVTQLDLVCKWVERDRHVPLV